MTMRPILVLASTSLLCGCHLIFPFEVSSSTDGGRDHAAAGDAWVRDGPGTTEHLAGTDAPSCTLGPFSAPVRVQGDQLNTWDDEWGPHLSPDELTIYFKRYSDNVGLGEGDIWYATRSSPTGTFSKPVNLGSLINSTCDEGGPAISADGKTLFLQRSCQNTEIWSATRADPTLPFSDPAPVNEVNTAPDQGEPFLTSDGLSLYFVSWREQSQDIWVATRDSTTSPFGPATKVPGINSEHHEMSPTLTADRLTIFFISDRLNGVEDFDVFIAERPDSDAHFGAPTLVKEVSTTGWDEYGVHISGDGRRLYLAYNVDMQGYHPPDMTADVWVATRGCLP
jgi:Tol biopolymer transport system component